MRRFLRIGGASLAIALLLSFVTEARAQSSQGGLRGIVKDAQGVIPGVTVTLVNEATNVTRDTTTNTSGEYSFPAVDPATYTVRVAVQGFKSFEQKGVRVSTQQFVGLDVSVRAGRSAECVQPGAVGGAREHCVRKRELRADQKSGEQYASGAVHVPVPFLDKTARGDRALAAPPRVSRVHAPGRNRAQASCQSRWREPDPLIGRFA